MKLVTMFKYFISTVLFLVAISSSAQEMEVEEKNTIVPDSLKPSYTPTGIRLGIDAFALGQTILNDEISSLLFMADIDFDRYFLVTEYGNYARTRSGENAIYEVDGSYYRIGVDINFLKNDPDNSMLSFGIRYGNANFNDRAEVNFSNNLYPNQTVVFENAGLSADWFELVAGLKVPVWKFWMGYNLRVKFGVDEFKDNRFSSYEVPGYGLAAEKDYWEFNYFVMYRIEWE